MDFKTEKTGKYLRSMALENGRAERERAMQALSHHYGTGSSATLAKLLLATLGHDAVETSTTRKDTAVDPGQSRTLLVEQIADPMCHGANDSDYANKRAGWSR